MSANLDGKVDAYRGITVRLTKDDLALTANDFREKLERSCASWKAEGTRGVWLRLPTSASTLVPAAVAVGFEFHHARPGYAMLTRWLPTDAGPSPLPAYPHHQFGVGGMVTNGKGQVLCIQEKSGRTGFWKLPGGLVDPGEDVAAAVVREVLEETGIRTEFVALAAFRESHAGPWQTTDMYAVCTLRLHDDYAKEGVESPVPTPQEKEIAKAEWMPLDDFLALPYYKNEGLFGTMLHVASETATATKDSAAGFRPTRLPLFFRDGDENMFHSIGSAVMQQRARL